MAGFSKSTDLGLTKTANSKTVDFTLSSKIIARRDNHAFIVLDNITGNLAVRDKVNL